MSAAAMDSHANRVRLRAAADPVTLSDLDVTGPLPSRSPTAMLVRASAEGQ
jgi:hypothetical protein